VFAEVPRAMALTREPDRHTFFFGKPKVGGAKKLLGD
jgi:hypothetical protein